jgi:hypothetical protein
MRRSIPRAILLLLALLVCAGPTQGRGQASAAFQPDPKYVFNNLTVSLEWQPGTDSLPADLALAGCPSSGVATSYLDDLKDGLRKTAAYLYTYSEGQLALGTITVYTNGEHWADADLRILASDSYRPSAFVGGIVNTPTQNISATSGMTGTVFYPATIFLGRGWDGDGARCGGWSQPPGWRTIGHEWAHYALYLYDEYFNADTLAEQYCTATGLSLSEILPGVSGGADSLMAYQYSADKLWLGSATPPHPGPPPWSCAGTPQAHVHGEPDWKTVKRFYNQVESFSNHQADIQFAGSPAEVHFSVGLPALPPDDTSAEVRLAPAPTAGLVGQAYLIRPSAASGSPQRIIGQGEIVTGEPNALPFWGVQASTKDRALVVLQDWASGVHACFPQSYDAAPALNPAAPNLLTATTSQWRPSLSITPQAIELGGISEVVGLVVRLEDCAAKKTQEVQAVYCPAGADCGAPVPMTPVSGSPGVFTHTFRFPYDGAAEPPALHGYIYVRRLDLPHEETAVWYQLAGGVGPATGNGHAPLADGAVDVSVAPGQPLPTHDTQLLFSPAQGCLNAGLILPPGVRGIFGTPIDVQPVVAGENLGHPWNSRLGDPQLQVRLSYSQDLLDRLGINEDQLVVLRLEKGQRIWQLVPIAGRSRALDWIAAAARPFDGQGAVYALGYRPPVWLPLVRR